MPSRRSWLEDQAAVLLLPLPHLAQERLAPEVVARLRRLSRELLLDHVLRRDAGVVHARARRASRGPPCAASARSGRAWTRRARGPWCRRVTGPSNSVLDEPSTRRLTVTGAANAVPDSDNSETRTPASTGYTTRYLHSNQPLSTRACGLSVFGEGLLAPGPLSPRLPVLALFRLAVAARLCVSRATSGIPGYSGGSAPDSHRLPFTSDRLVQPSYSQRPRRARRATSRPPDRFPRRPASASARPPASPPPRSAASRAPGRPVYRTSGPP